MAASRVNAVATVSRQEFARLKNVLPAATRECLFATFGISETTWVKLRDGKPVKRSTLDRVFKRYQAVASGARGPRPVFLREAGETSAHQG
jgi:hypothetical protein